MMKKMVINLIKRKMIRFLQKLAKKMLQRKNPHKDHSKKTKEKRNQLKRKKL